MLVEGLARRCIAKIGVDPGILNAVRWVSDRYAELAGKTGRQEAERAEGLLVLPALLSTGTVSVTNGSTTVTPDSDALATFDDGALVGRWFRTLRGKPLYEIVSQDASTFRLATAFVEDTDADSAYEIIARFHSLDDAARHVGKISHRQGPLIEWTQERLDTYFPDREETDEEPRYWAPAGVDDLGRIRVEVYPSAPSTGDVALRYTYWRSPTDFKKSDTLPEHIDVYVLEKGVLADICRWKASELRSGAMDSQVSADRAAVMTATARDFDNRADRFESVFMRKLEDGVRAATVGKGPRLVVADEGRIRRRPRQARDDVETLY